MSAPVPVSLGGYDRLYLELQVPRDLDPASCEREAYFVWEDRSDDAQHVLNDAGEVEKLWILDVDGDRVVLGVITAPGLTRTRSRELVEAVESVRFVAAP